MAKDNTKNTKKNFIEKRTKPNNTTEYVINGSPSKTWWGRVIVALIVAGTVLIPVISLLVVLFK